MNEVSTIATDPTVPFQKKGGMTPAEAAYMRGGKEPAAGSVPLSTSKYLNSPLYVHAFTTMSLRRMGNDVPTTYDIPAMSRGLDDVADYAEAARLIAEERGKNAAFAAWLDRRRTPCFDPEVLARYPDGTFGGEVRAFMKQGYKVDFINTFEAKTDLDYVLKMVGQTHDLQHIATGFGANHAGEHALAFMNVAVAYAYFSPELAGVVTAASMFVSVALLARVSLHYRPAMPLVLEAMRMGIEQGQKLTQPLFMIDWDACYGRPVEEVAASLGVDRGPGDEWAYSEDLCTG